MDAPAGWAPLSPPSSITHGQTRSPGLFLPQQGESRASSSPQCHAGCSRASWMAMSVLLAICGFPGEEEHDAPTLHQLSLCAQLNYRLPRVGGGLVNPVSQYCSIPPMHSPGGKFGSIGKTSPWGFWPPGAHQRLELDIRAIGWSLHVPHTPVQLV